MNPSAVASLEHVLFIRNSKALLDDISLTIESGQHWAIIGPNGSGKTSLISIINGYHQPSNGKVEVLGRKFGESDLRELRLHIGECSSEIRSMLHPGEHVKDIVLSGRYGSIGLYQQPGTRDIERAEELMEFLGITRLSDSKFRTLSHGEQQKTIIARALMPEPRILVLDEPCEGLDIRAREELLDVVQDMCSKPGGPVLIYITHRIEEIIPAVTHVAALKSGRLIAGGLKEDVLKGDTLSRTFDLLLQVHVNGGRFWPEVYKS